MHYCSAVTSQSHAVYYIKFVLLFVLRCTRIPLQRNNKNLPCNQLHVQICVIVFMFDKSQTPYSAGICVSPHLTVFRPHKERASSRWLHASPQGLQSEISVCLFLPKVAVVKPHTWKMTDFDNAIYISV